MSAPHLAVLLEETMASLSPKSPGCYADVTLGAGGHAEAILDRSAPQGSLIGLDRDPNALALARDRLAQFGARAELVHAKLSELPALLEDREIAGLDGLIADLGLSSMQLDEPERGFSLQTEGPIDMRMDPSSGESALELIARLDADALANVLYEYGEERRSRPIARSIRKAHEDGELHTTRDLRRAVIRATGPKRGRIDPATQTFQALRIAVNDELGELEALLGALPEILKEGGVAAIISFHSLEDRLVKRAFRSDEHLAPLTKRPVVADDAERERNPRSRSAKLRAARRLGVSS